MVMLAPPVGLLEVFGVPVEVALHAVALETGAGDAVPLAGVDDELGGDAQAAQRLVHLLAPLERNVGVAVAAQEDGWRFDPVGVQERVGELLVGGPGFGIPGRTDLVVVLNDVLI